MSLDHIRAKAQQFEAKTRRWRDVGRAAFIVIVIANIVEFFWPDQAVLERLGNVLVLAAVLYVTYEYRRTQPRLASMPEGLGLTSCLDFHRTQLAQERDFSLQSRRYLLPFVPGVFLGLLGGVSQSMSTSRVIAAGAAGVVLFLGVAWWNTYTARKLQREIDAL